MLNKNIFFTVTFLLTMLAGIAGYHYLIADKIACINLTKVFDGFNMKKELQKEYERNVNIIQKELDSLSIVVQEIQSKQQDEQFRNSESYQRIGSRVKFLLSSKESLEGEDVKIMDNQIQERMNIYLKEFGEAHSFDFLLAYSNDFPVLYCDTTNDVTVEAIEFINDRYDGK